MDGMFDLLDSGCEAGDVLVYASFESLSGANAPGGAGEESVGCASFEESSDFAAGAASDYEELSDEAAIRAAERSRQFFNLPEVTPVNAEGTCVRSKDPSAPAVGVFGFNRKQLAEVGIKGEDSLTLVYTRECARRALQVCENLDAWREELSCDFFAGVRAEMAGIDIANIEASLRHTAGSELHPTGSIRADFIEYGKEAAAALKAEGLSVTFDNCLDRLEDRLAENDGLIDNCRQDAAETASFNWIKNFVDDRKRHINRADRFGKEIGYYEQKAAEARSRGDFSDESDCIWEINRYKRYIEYEHCDADLCTK